MYHTEGTKDQHDQDTNDCATLGPYYISSPGDKDVTQDNLAGWYIV